MQFSLLPILVIFIFYFSSALHTTAAYIFMHGDDVDLCKVLLRVLMMGDNVKEAIDARRFHHQLMPMQVNHSL